MNGEEPIIGQLEYEELEQVAGDVGADHENLGRVSVRVHIDNDNRMVDGVEDVRIRDAMTSGRAVNLHTIAAYYVKRACGRGRAPRRSRRNVTPNCRAQEIAGYSVAFASANG